MPSERNSPSSSHSQSSVWMRMTRLKLVVIFFLVFVKFVSGKIVSNYERTKVFYEPSGCSQYPYHNLISTSTAGSIIECGTQCTANTDCRRVMFDRKSKQCSLFGSGENCFTDQSVQDKVCFRQKSVCGDVSCPRCPIGYYGNRCQNIIQDCSDGEARDVAPKKKIMSYIQPTINGPVLEVKCDFQWSFTVIQNRLADCTETDFNRTWEEYSTGFGNIHAEYWLGLEHVYNILQNHPNFLMIVTIYTDTWHQCKYYEFKITNSSDGYKVSVGGWFLDSANSLGDSLTNGIYNVDGRPFSTYDRDYSNHDCPVRFKAGWWYLDDPVCSRANVNGRKVDSNTEAIWHWYENMGSRTNFDSIDLRLERY